MEYKDILENFRFVINKSLESGLFKSIEETQYAFNLFNRVSAIAYDTREAYDEDVRYIFSLANILHDSGKLSFEDSYHLYATFVEVENMNLTSSTSATYEPVSQDGEISYGDLINAVNNQ